MGVHSRIIIAGRITLDCYAYKEDIGINKKFTRYLEVESGNIFLGGSAGNIAIWLAAIKCPVILSFSIGKDNASILIKSILNQIDMPTYIDYCDTSTSISIVLIDKHAEPYFLHSVGASKEFNLSALSSIIKSDDILVIAGIPLLKSLHGKKWNSFYHSLKEKPKMVVTSLCHGQSGDNFYPILDNTNILFGNAKELSSYDLDSNYLFNRYKNLHTVIMTQGEKGSIIYNREEKIRIPSKPTNIIDTCGAGDSFVAGTLSGLFHNRNIQESCLLGSHLASICCSIIGPSCPPSNLYDEVGGIFSWIKNLKKEV